MPHRRRVLAIVAAISTLFFGSLPAASSPAPLSEAADEGQPPVATHEVTLITGDLVTVTELDSGHRTITPHPGEGRDDVTFMTWGHGDEVSVVPSDALPLLVSGRLDERLFDVTGLVEQGYDDANSAELPLIIEHTGETRGSMAVESVIAGAAAEDSRRLSSIDATAVSEDRAAAGALWSQVTGDETVSDARTLRAGITKVWLDARVTTTLAESVDQIRAPQAWEAGHTGEGVTVGVLDSGIDAEHPDLVGVVREARDFTDSPSGAQDVDGHGTHVASTIAGRGEASDGQYVGVAPDAQLLVGKVIGDNGEGTTSQVIAGMEWAAEQGADIVNMSLGVAVPSDGTDLISVALNELTDQSGTLFVVAAGNVRNVLGAPAAADAALTVGAVDKQDVLAAFSSRGPRIIDHAIKPDITAPGVGIVAARADGAFALDPVGSHYMSLDGTSMAAPHAAGVAAILAEQHPNWTPERTKAALTSAAEPISGYTVFEQGAGRLDVAKAVNDSVQIVPANLSFYVAHGQAEPVTRTVTFQNSGHEDVSIDLKLDVSDEEGTRLPQGLLSLDAPSVTVPAGSTAQAEITVLPDLVTTGSYTGTLTAADETGVVARALLGTYLEPPSHDVVIRGVNRDGGPADFDVRLLDIATAQPAELHFDEGEFVGRIPEGEYTLNSFVLNSDEVGSVTMFQRPKVVVDRDTEIVLDARDGHEVRADVDAPEATRTGLHSIAAVQFINETQVSMEASVDAATELYAVPTQTSTERPYIFRLFTTLVEPPELDRPRAYNLALVEHGQIPERLDMRVHDDDLAQVDTRYLAQGVAGSATRANVPDIEGFPHHGVALSHDVTLPDTVNELFSTEQITWLGVLEFGTVGGEPVQMSVHAPLEQYDAGSQQSRTWNAPVFGPVAKGTHFGSGISLQIDPVSPGQLGHLQYPGFMLPGVAGALTLKRDGEVVAEADNPLSAWASVAPEKADYELEMTATRDVEWSDFATRTQARWEFTSAAPQEGVGNLPLLTSRVSGAFDDYGRAVEGVLFPLDLDFEYLGSTDEPEVSSVRAWVSFDDGERWRPVPVTRRDESWQAMVVHRSARPDSEYASLRFAAEDVSGGTVEIETIRAYGLPGSRD